MCCGSVELSDFSVLKEDVACNPPDDEKDEIGEHGDAVLDIGAPTESEC